MLNGWKTYLVAAALAVVVAIERGLGIDIPGVEVGEDWLVLLLNAAGLGALRHGIARGLPGGRL